MRIRDEYVTTLMLHFPETSTEEILDPRTKNEGYGTLSTIF